MDGQATAQLAAVLTDRLAEDHRVINVVGPLGVGKSRLLAELRATDLIVVDAVDSADALTGLIATVRDAPTGSLVVAAGRRPLAAWPQWRSHEPPVTIHVDPWPPARIESLARILGIRHQGELRLVMALSGGIPLIAEQLSRSLLCGVPVDARAAVASAAAREVLRRLAAEGADTVAEALTALAALGAADEEMLAQHLMPGGFDILAELSVVRRDAPGLVLVEPYRTLIDLGLRWRRPLARQALLAGGIQHRLRQVAAQRDRREQAAIAGPTLALLDDQVVQESLFPAAEPRVQIRPAGPGDEEDTVQLTRLWARRSQLDAKACGRMLETWWACQPTGFYLAVRPDGRAVGMSNILPLRESATPAQELLLQQHTDALRADADGTSGVLVGLAVSGDDDPAVHAAILRHVLVTGVQAERLLVSTPWLPYQRLCERLGLRHRGDTRHDVYRCGRPNGIYLQDFAMEALPAWLSRVSSGGVEWEQDWERHVREALAHLGEPARLAASPLVGLPVTGSAGALAAVLRAAIEVLGASGVQQDAEAAQAITWRYVDPSGGAAARIGGSRATYFRRLRLGVRRVTEIVQAMSGDSMG